MLTECSSKVRLAPSPASPASKMAGEAELHSTGDAILLGGFAGPPSRRKFCYRRWHKNASFDSVQSILTKTSSSLEPAQKDRRRIG